MEIQATTNFSANKPANGIGVLPTPPALKSAVSQDTLEITNAKAPEDIKNAGKKRKGPVGFINFLWLGVASICSAVAIKDILKLFKK